MQQRLKQLFGLALGFALLNTEEMKSLSKPDELPLKIERWDGKLHLRKPGCSEVSHI